MSAFLVLAFFVGGEWREHALPVPGMKTCHAILIDRRKAGATLGPNEMIWCDRRQQ